MLAEIHRICLETWVQRMHRLGGADAERNPSHTQRVTYLRPPVKDGAVRYRTDLDPIGTGRLSRLPAQHHVSAAP